VKIVSVDSRREALELARPYTIATRRIESVELFFLRLATDDGLVGLGSASPAHFVTGETADACATALDRSSLDWLVGADARQLGRLLRELERGLPDTPAARAAVDMALHDLLARKLGVPLVDLLGRCHDELETSITIGIKPLDETLADAGEYLGRGFRCLKTKIGLDREQDLERLTRLRETVGPDVRIRVDANQGYDETGSRGLLDWVERLDLELVEQPVAASAVDVLRRLPEALRRVVAADESLHGPTDAMALAAAPAACGIFNIKLMKCGGIAPALAIATIARASGISLMWGCNDESAISIAAALHAAYASPATRYLDLDGSFDLGRDLAEGGFTVHDGRMRLTPLPGLGFGDIPH